MKLQANTRPHTNDKIQTLQFQLPGDYDLNSLNPLHMNIAWNDKVGAELRLDAS